MILIWHFRLVTVMFMQSYFRSYENERNEVTSRRLPVQLGISLRIISIISDFWTSKDVYFGPDCHSMPSVHVARPGQLPTQIAAAGRGTPLLERRQSSAAYIPDIRRQQI